MATDFTTALHEDWKRACNKLCDLRDSLAACQADQRDEIEQAIAVQEEDVLDTPAPTLMAVLIKLELLFDGQLEGLHPDAEYRRLVIEDLGKLIEHTSELVGSRTPPRIDIEA